MNTAAPAVYEYLKMIPHIDFSTVSKKDVFRAIDADALTESDLFALLSPAATEYLEIIAARAHDVTLRNFGKTISLYVPLYLANHCVNDCAYCGYRAGNRMPRLKLSYDDVRLEARAMSKTEIKHILILTGESRHSAPFAYIKECVTILKEYFSAISIEVYPLNQEEYEALAAIGVDGLTVYQETYNETRYAELHPSGPKQDYRYRLETPDRAARARIRTIGIGALMGLSEWRREASMTALHARYLETVYPEIEISVSIPRIQPEIGGYLAPHAIDDAAFVQIMLALRLFLPRAGIAVSTRERASFRDNLIGLGVTKMSAGSKTTVGGYARKAKDEGQFDIADARDVRAMREMIEAKGYQPVFKDWHDLIPLV